jgi:hypothetical protein
MGRLVDGVSASRPYFAGISLTLKLGSEVLDHTANRCINIVSLWLGSERDMYPILEL